MPASRFRISYRVFAAFVVIGLVMLSIATVFVLGIGQSRLRDSYGDHLAQIADQTAATVDSYVYRRVMAVSVLARVPEIREVAAASNRQPADAKTVAEIDREWQEKHSPPAAVAGLFANPASRFLADATRQDPIYRELLVADRAGRLVAASATTSDYYQADEPWWTETFGGGVRGRPYVSGVTYDDSSHTWALEVAVPVEDPAGNSVAGVLKAVIDVRELVATVGAVRPGATGEALLLRDDGTIVLSARPHTSNAQFFAPELLRENLSAALEGKKTRMVFTARDQDGQPRLVGLAFSQLRASYPGLTWLVAVSQSEDELFAPVRSQIGALILLLALTAVAVLVLALWFSIRLAAPAATGDLHLVEHPAIPRLEDAKTDE